MTLDIKKFESKVWTLCKSHRVKKWSNGWRDPVKGYKRFIIEHKPSIEFPGFYQVESLQYQDILNYRITIKSENNPFSEDTDTLRVDVESKEIDTYFYVMNEMEWEATQSYLLEIIKNNVTYIDKGLSLLSYLQLDHPRYGEFPDIKPWLRKEKLKSIL